MERALAGQGIEAYLPVVNRTTFYAHRKRVVSTPLFSCYVFMKGTAEARMAAFDTKRVARIIDVTDQDRLEHELTQIRRAIEAAGSFLPAPYLEKGTPVRVTRGPFRDVEGVVESRRFPNRLVLQIQTLGRATSVEIDEDVLEPIEPVGA